VTILVDRITRVVVQGVTGREGEFHAGRMIDFGTAVVAGVTPGRGGQRACSGAVPVFDSVRAAVAATDANTSVVFVPAPHAPDAILEAAASGIRLIVCITEGIPVHDMMLVRASLRGRASRLIGPNCPGVMAPGVASVGIMPGTLARRGSVGVVSRSGTLTYEVMRSLNARGLGQSTCVGIGGDPIVGSSFVDVLRLFEHDPDTAQVVLIGEIGGNDEEKAAEYISSRFSKPVIAFVAGRSAPPGKRMGHAGAIIEGSSGRADDKIAALRAAGARVADGPDQVAEIVGRIAGIA
jgi:succinyl-CoA synthetase alpha subunit